MDNDLAHKFVKKDAKLFKVTSSKSLRIVKAPSVCFSRVSVREAKENG